LAFDDTSGVSTGIAVANLSAIPIDVRVLARDESAPGDRAAIRLQAQGHNSFALAGMVARERRGPIEFVTPEFGRISVAGLRFAPARSGAASLFDRHARAGKMSGYARGAA